MRPTPVDEISDEIDRLEQQLAVLQGWTRQTDATRARLTEIGVTIERLRLDAAKLKGS